MQIDLKNRDVCAYVLRGLIRGALDTGEARGILTDSCLNDPGTMMGKYGTRDLPDVALREFWKLYYSLDTAYLAEARFVGKRKLPKETLDLLERFALFLKTDLPYTWSESGDGEVPPKKKIILEFPRSYWKRRLLAHWIVWQYYPHSYLLPCEIKSCEAWKSFKAYRNEIRILRDNEHNRRLWLLRAQNPVWPFRSGEELNDAVERYGWIT